MALYYSLLALSLATLSHGQSSDVTCSPDYDWAFNNNDQSPCLVSSYLQSVCAGPIPVDSVPPGMHYRGPSAAGATPCNCNTVVFSLTSACALCQGRAAQNWTRWSENCPSDALFISEYPRDIPEEVEVPQWAYIDVTTLTGQLWGPIQAKIVADAASSTSGSSTPSDSSTSSDEAPTESPTGALSSPEPPKSEGKSNAGAIAGGVVGGLVFLIGVGLLVFWLLLRKKRKAQNAPPDDFTIDGSSIAPLGAARSPPPASFRTNAMSPVSRTTYDDGSSVAPGVPMAPTSAIQTTRTTRRSQDTLDSSFNGTQMVAVRPPGAYTGSAEV